MENCFVDSEYFKWAAICR